MPEMTRRDLLRLAAGGTLAAAVGGGWVRTVAASDAYSGVVLAKGPSGYWRLGEAIGPVAADSSPNRNDGVYRGAPEFGQVGAIAHDPDTAIGCHGPSSADLVEIADRLEQPFSQPTSGQGLTVEAWMRPDVLVLPGGDVYIHWLGKGGAGRHEWGFRFYSQDSERPNRISAYIWNPEGGLGAGAYFEDALTPGAWIHVVACYEPGDADTPDAGVHIYANGIHRLGPPSPGTLYSTYGIRPAAGDAPLRLGTRDMTSYLTGGLDEVAVYPRVLTAAEIMENYRTAIA